MRVIYSGYIIPVDLETFGRHGGSKVVRDFLPCKAKYNDLVE